MNNEETITIGDYKKIVRQKVTKAKDLLMHGVLGKGMGKLCDADGYDWTKSNIVNIATNYYEETKGEGISPDPASLGAIDFSIYLQTHSLIPYVAISRALRKPEDEITYMNIDFDDDGYLPTKPNFVNVPIKTRTFRLFYKASSFADFQLDRFEKIAHTLVEDLNRELIDLLFNMAEDKSDTKTLDLGEYEEKYSNSDLISNFFVVLKSQFIRKTNVCPTVLITGSKGVTLLRTHQDYWQDVPEDIGEENGIVGTFKGMPVFRHIRVDQLESCAEADDQAWFLMAHRSANNATAAVAYGEYLPLHKNTEDGEGIYDQQCGFIPIQKHQIIKGIITSPTFA